MQERHNRHSIRLKGYDYTSPGWYFITINTKYRKHLFGYIKDGKMHLSAEGKIAEMCWLEIPNHFPQAIVDVHMIMLDHMHGLVGLPAAAKDAASTKTKPDNNIERFGKPVAGSIPTIVRSYKSAVTNKINQLHNTPGVKIWQRNYWERIAKDEWALFHIRKYIKRNPVSWSEKYQNTSARKE